LNRSALKLSSATRLLTVFLLLSSVFILLLAPLPLVHASSGVIQQSAGGCAQTGCGYIPPITVSFPSSVTAGDVIVVAIGAELGVVVSVSDTLGSTFTQALSNSVALSGFLTMYTYIYYATLSSGGSDNVSVMLSSSDMQAGVYIYEVSGVTVTGLTTETGTGTCSSSPCSISTSSSASFSSGALLLGMVGTVVYSTPTPGSGFALYSGSNSGLAAFGGYAESATGGVTSPTNFPFTFSSSSMTWAEVGVALEPSNSTSSTSTTISTTLPLTDTVGVSDTFSNSLGLLLPLTDTVGVIDAFGHTLFQQLMLPLTDTVGVTDAFGHTLFQQLMLPLTDTVGVGDTFGHSLGLLLSLTDGVGVVDSFAYSLGLLHIYRMMIIVDPAYVLITAPGGGQVGCDSNGNVMNTISGATVTGCSTGTETITIPSPAPGSYKIQIAAFGTSSSFTITFETTDSNGNQLGSSSYSGTVDQGSPQTVFSTITPSGQVTISSSPLPGVPEFPGSFIIVVVAILLLSLNYVRKRNRS
jgi:hypothetical protein